MFVISGPSCVGKSTTINTLINVHQYIGAVPYTSRKMRPGETPGVEYHFLSLEEMRNLSLNEEGFWDRPVDSDIYGYKKADIDLIALEENSVVQASVSIAKQIRNHYEKAVLVFLDFESEEERIRRVSDRFPSDAIASRLIHTERERREIRFYDYVLQSDLPCEFTNQLMMKEGMRSNKNITRP